jgi:hypothetical protein
MTRILLHIFLCSYHLQSYTIFISLELFKDIIQFVRALDKNILPGLPSESTLAILALAREKSRPGYHRAKVRAFALKINSFQFVIVHLSALYHFTCSIARGIGTEALVLMIQDS